MITQTLWTRPLIALQCGEVDTEAVAAHEDNEKAASLRPIGLAVLEYIKSSCDDEQSAENYV